ncbi:hypothetical protein D3C81_1015570 [compost metagenome]
MVNALTRLTQKSSMMIEKGNAVMSVMVCKACNPPVFNNISAKMASRAPQNIICHFGDFSAFLLAILFITYIPESAEVTKKIIIIRITR